MGAMATTDITATFTGDASLRGRPMGRVTEPLALFGAEARGRRGGRLPITLTGAANPMPVQYTTPVASAQVKSAVLLAGLNAPGRDGGDRARADAGPHRAHAGGLRRERRHRGDGGGAGDHPARPAGAGAPGDRRAARPELGRLPGGGGADGAGLGGHAAGDRAQPDARGVLRHAARHGRGDRLREPPQGGGRAGGGPAGALRGAEGSGGAAGARGLDDRRVPHPRRAGGDGGRRDGHARHQGAARQGERPDRRDGARARGLRRRGSRRARTT